MTTATPRTPALIFGREPALITSAIMSLVAIVSGFVFNISTDTQGYIQAAVNAVLALVVAISVRENVLPVIIALAQAVMPLVIVAGWELTVEQQASIIAALSLTLGVVFVRPQVTPKATITAVQTGPNEFDATR